MVDPDTQHERWCQAVQLLGGPRSAAAAIGVGEKTIYRLIKRESDLHDGFLHDTAAALQRRARECLDLEKLITPAFSRNLVDAQPRETGNRLRHRKD
jgi:hypothetical protein